MASLTRAFSSLCCTLATSAGSASAGSECAYSVIDRSHWATAMLQVAGLLVDLAEMIVDRGVGVAALVRLAQVLFGQRILTRLEVDPAQRIEIGVVLRFEIDRLANQGERFGEPDAAIGEHVAEIVEYGRVLRIDGQSLAELSLGLVVHLLTVVERAPEKYTRAYRPAW